MRFDGARILLTGGSGALGSLIARRLVAEGADVTVADRAPPATDGVAFLEADLSSASGIEAAAGALTTRPVDVLVNLAGIQWFGPLEDQPPEQLLAGYMVNLIAPARLAQAVLPQMKSRRRGHLVNIGSVFGSINFAHFASYSSSKAGLRGLSQALRRELVGTGVAVTYIAPRAVRTPLNSPLVLRYAALTGMNMDAPEPVAGRIVEAIARKTSEVYLGFPESAFVRINAVLPGLVDRALRNADLKARRLFSPPLSQGDHA